MNGNLTTPSDRDPLGLSGLPELGPNEDRWSRIRAALKTAHASGDSEEATDSAPRLWPVALAAALALAISLPWLVPLQTGLPGIEHTAEEVAQDTTGSTASNPAEATETPSDLVRLQRQSQLLAAALRASQQYQPALSGEAAIYAVELEDTIARMDQALAEDPDSATLWRGRVGLMTDLLAVYRNDGSPDEPMMI